MAAFFGGGGGGGYHQGMGGMGGGSRLPQTFDEEYNCYSFAFQDNTHLEGSDKIFLPPSALDTLARLHIDYPMLFQITCRASGKKTHCGVLEFSAAEGSCYLPYWMMQNLMLEEGGFLQVREGGRDILIYGGSCYLPCWMMQNLMFGGSGLLAGRGGREGGLLICFLCSFC